MKWVWKLYYIVFNTDVKKVRNLNDFAKKFIIIKDIQASDIFLIPYPISL